MQEKTISYKMFVAEYCPIKNPKREDDSFDGYVFHTDTNILDICVAEDNKRIWTVCDDGIISGRWNLNRLGYIITEKPADAETVYVNFEDDTRTVHQKAVEIAVNTFLSIYEGTANDVYVRLTEETIETEWADIDYAVVWAPFQQYQIADVLTIIDDLTYNILNKFDIEQ